MSLFFQLYHLKHLLICNALLHIYVEFKHINIIMPVLHGVY